MYFNGSLTKGIELIAIEGYPRTLTSSTERHIIALRYDTTSRRKIHIVLAHIPDPAKCRSLIERYRLFCICLNNYRLYHADTPLLDPYAQPVTQAVICMPLHYELHITYGDARAAVYAVQCRLHAHDGNGL